MGLPIGQDESKFVIFQPDGVTPRVVFEVSDGRVRKAEKIDVSRFIPANGFFDVDLMLGSEQEAMIYTRALTANISTIDGLIKFLTEQLNDART